MDIEKHNEALGKLSREAFGDGFEFRMVDPKALVLLKNNARYFKKATFHQLVENIKYDNRLSSVPLCRQLEDGRLEVLSGNHRVKASIEAGIACVMVMIIKGNMEESEKISIQLSHNSLVGEDDPGILKDLWDRIDDIKSKLYAGLSSDQLKELKNIKLTTFTTPCISTKTVSFSFTTHELELLEQAVAELEAYTGAKKWIFPIEQFESFFELLKKIKKIEGIKNGSVAMLRLLEIAQGYIEGKES